MVRFRVSVRVSVVVVKFIAVNVSVSGYDLEVGLSDVHDGSFRGQVSGRRQMSGRNSCPTFRSPAVALWRCMAPPAIS